MGTHPRRPEISWLRCHLQPPTPVGRSFVCGIVLKLYTLSGALHGILTIKTVLSVSRLVPLKFSGIQSTWAYTCRPQ